MRVRTVRRTLHLCCECIKQRLPFTGRVTIHVETPFGCDTEHPEFERILSEAARELRL